MQNDETVKSCELVSVLFHSRSQGLPIVASVLGAPVKGQRASGYAVAVNVLNKFAIGHCHKCSISRS